MRSVYACNFTLPNNNKFAYRTDRFACIFSYGPSGMIGLHASHAVGTTCVLGTKRVNPKNHHKIQKHTTTLKLSQFQKYYQPLSLWRKKFDFHLFNYNRSLIFNSQLQNLIDSKKKLQNLTGVGAIQLSIRRKFGVP